MTTSAPTPTPAKPAEETAYDAMASAFDSLLAPEDTTPIEGEEAPAETPAETPSEAPAETPASADTKEGETASEEVAEPPKEAPPAEEDWQARFKELEARVAQQQPPPVEEKPPVETPPPDVYTAEEKDFLKEYAEQWPDIVKGEELRRRDEYRQLVSHIFSEIARVYAPLIERGAQAADTVAESTTIAAIQRVHSDYDEALYNDVFAWASTLTGMRGKVAQSVIEEGDPQDVIDLISEFKQVTGRSKPKVVAGTAAPAAQSADVTELSAKAKQAAKALGVVDSKRTAPTSTAVDPDDFDAAWAEAVGNK